MTVRRGGTVSLPPREMSVLISGCLVQRLSSARLLPGGLDLARLL